MMESSMRNNPPGATGGQPPQPVSQDPQQPQACSMGKLRKSAFRFFSGRKSICMLPSFLVGRSRAQAKGVSKTGVSKSQTYDGVSGACWEDRGGRGDVTSADFEFHNPNSLVDARKLQESFERSQSLLRHKRGLRGFLSSIRRHRRNKNLDLETSETFEMSSGKVVQLISPNVEHLGLSDHLESNLESNVHTEASSVNFQTPTKMHENRPMNDILEPKVCLTEEERHEQMKSEEETEEEGGMKSGLATYQQPLCAESELLRLVELRNDLPESEPCTLYVSSDNLIFGDVSSLKSFDSLTGCGDIIAEQDDVSMAESSVSGERVSRSGGKRSSCLVTYQGGGEEMATPDQVANEYLDSLWESEGREVCYLPLEQTLSLSTTPDPPTSSGNTGTSPSGVNEAGLMLTNDLLTPQSDQQGSVPNSDEGYYDSTTPGADEELCDLPLKEKLSRDSYSGDALYELFEADDELLSPQVNTKEDQGFLGHNNKGGILYTLETGNMETEEERLSKIQHALLCCEFQNLRNTYKVQPPYCTDYFYGNKIPSDVTPQHQTLKELQRRTQSVPDSVKSANLRLNTQVLERPMPLQDFKRERSKESAPMRCGRQSQEDLMVCFSQALMDFTKSSQRYRDSAESLGSEASSPFGSSLSALPTIVTFDVVDMENEGECEQPEPAEEEEEEEDVTSPYEEFEDDGCYLQQDAFAECDHRTFDAYEQSLLFRHALGITSLPRHLGLSRAWPPVPAPLSLNRRSRSLDTDSLELQTNDLNTSVLARGRNGVDFGLPLEGSPWLDDLHHASCSKPSARPSYLPLQMTYPQRSMAHVEKTSKEQKLAVPSPLPSSGEDSSSLCDPGYSSSPFRPIQCWQRDNSHE